MDENTRQTIMIGCFSIFFLMYAVIPFIKASLRYFGKRNMTGIPAFIFYMIFAAFGGAAYYVGLTGGHWSLICVLIIFGIVFLGFAMNFLFGKDFN